MQGPQERKEDMTPDPKNKPIRLKGEEYSELRKNVGKRAGWRCENCYAFAPLTVEGMFDVFTCGHVRHIKSRGSGGGDTMDNAQWWCYSCHIKGDHGLRWSEKRK